MTSKPASRRPRATTLAPRSCPSRPGFATRTRIRSSAKVRPRDDDALDLGGALVQGGDARVTEQALDLVLLAVAVAAVDLEGLVRAEVRGLRRRELRHRHEVPRGRAPVLQDR